MDVINIEELIVSTILNDLNCDINPIKLEFVPWAHTTKEYNDVFEKLRKRTGDEYGFITLENNGVQYSSLESLKEFLWRISRGIYFQPTDDHNDTKCDDTKCGDDIKCDDTKCDDDTKCGDEHIFKVQLPKDTTLLCGLLCGQVLTKIERRLAKELLEHSGFTMNQLFAMTKTLKKGLVPNIVQDAQMGVLYVCFECFECFI